MNIYITSSTGDEKASQALACILRNDGHEVKSLCEKTTCEESKQGIEWCDAVIMIFPSCNYAHLQAGYAKGLGKKLFLWDAMPNGYHGFADLIFSAGDINSLLTTLHLTPETSAQLIEDFQIIAFDSEDKAPL